jgi:hypothetical protein
MPFLSKQIISACTEMISPRDPAEIKQPDHLCQRTAEIFAALADMIWLNSTAEICFFPLLHLWHRDASAEKT